jgi:hypothetical protein
MSAFDPKRKFQFMDEFRVAQYPPDGEVLAAGNISSDRATEGGWGVAGNALRAEDIAAVAQQAYVLVLPGKTVAAAGPTPQSCCSLSRIGRFARWAPVDRFVHRWTYTLRG